MIRLKHCLLILLFCAAFCAKGWGQSFEVTPPSFAIKSNFVSWATGTFNLAAETRIADRYTLNIAAGYNPWTFADNQKWKHVSIMPELRYWTCTPFAGHFFGVHALYSNFNVGNVKLPFNLFPGLETERWEGEAFGAGIAYGYSFYLAPRWSLEASIGVGYAYLNHDTYECAECGKLLGTSAKHYMGPTKAAISLIYIIK